MTMWKHTEVLADKVNSSSSLSHLLYILLFSISDKQENISSRYEIFLKLKGNQLSVNIVIL